MTKTPLYRFLTYITSAHEEFVQSVKTKLEQALLAYPKQLLQCDVYLWGSWQGAPQQPEYLQKWKSMWPMPCQ